MRTDDLRINRVRPLIAPAILAEDIPLTDAAASVVANGTAHWRQFSTVATRASP